MWDGSHTYQGIPQYRIRCCRYVHPKPRFEVNTRWCFISLSSFGIGYIVDGLHIGHAIEEDVLLRCKPTIGYAAKGCCEGQCFLGQVELQDVVASLFVEWAEDRIEALSGKDSAKLRQDPKRRVFGRGMGSGWGRLGLKARQLLVESVVLRLKSESRRETDDCGSNIWSGHG